MFEFLTPKRAPLREIASFVPPRAKIRVQVGPVGEFKKKSS